MDRRDKKGRDTFQSLALGNPRSDNRHSSLLLHGEDRYILGVPYPPLRSYGDRQVDIHKERAEHLAEQ